MSPSELDNEGRPYDMGRVVVNFNNVGTTYGKKVLKVSGAGYHWEGVRRCVKYLKEELRLGVVGVIFENWKAPDAGRQFVHGVPADIAEMCETVEETPRCAGAHQRSADDEMTLKCAYRRNCRFLDNDNYRDWLMRMRNSSIRDWLSHSQDRLHMKYYFDSVLGCFDTLDGNAEDGIDREAKAACEKRRRRAQSTSLGHMTEVELPRPRSPSIRPSHSGLIPSAAQVGLRMASHTLAAALRASGLHGGVRKAQVDRLRMPPREGKRAAPLVIDLISDDTPFGPKEGSRAVESRHTPSASEQPQKRTRSSKGPVESSCAIANPAVAAEPCAAKPNARRLNVTPVTVDPYGGSTEVATADPYL